MTIPNLDKMNARDLLSFWVQYRTPTKEQADALLEDTRGNTGLASLLASYAWTQAQILGLKAKTNRKKSDEDRLVLYTKGCETYYNQLPPDIQWRNKTNGQRSHSKRYVEQVATPIIKPVADDGPRRFLLAPSVEPERVKPKVKSQPQPLTVASIQKKLAAVHPDPVGPKCLGAPACEGEFFLMVYEDGKTQQARRKRDLIRRAQEKKLAFKSCEPIPHSPACLCSTLPIAMQRQPENGWEAREFPKET